MTYFPPRKSPHIHKMYPLAEALSDVHAAGKVQREKMWSVNKQNGFKHPERSERQTLLAIQRVTSQASAVERGSKDHFHSNLLSQFSHYEIFIK